MRPKARKSDVIENYDYILIYVDEVLAIGDDSEEVLKWVDKYFGLKPGLLADLNIYLSERVKLVELPNDFMAWSLRPSNFVQEVVNNIETYMRENIGERW